MAGSIQLLEPCWTATNHRFGRVIYKYINIDMFLYMCVFKNTIIFPYIHIQYVPYIHVGREPLKTLFESSWWKSPVLFVTRPWYFCPCLKVDHYLNNSKMHPVTLKFWKKKKNALSLLGVLELPILRGSWFCCFVSNWPKWTCWSYFFGWCWSRKAGNLWIYKQVPKPPRSQFGRLA